MSKQQDMDIAWRRCIEKDKEVQEELLRCRKERRETPNYRTLVKDAAKLKAEFDRRNVRMIAVSVDPLEMPGGEIVRKLAAAALVFVPVLLEHYLT